MRLRAWAVAGVLSERECHALSSQAWCCSYTWRYVLEGCTVGVRCKDCLGDWLAVALSCRLDFCSTIPALSGPKPARDMPWSLVPGMLLPGATCDRYVATCAVLQMRCLCKTHA